jgi:hypothetical protein
MSFRQVEKDSADSVVYDYLLANLQTEFKTIYKFGAYSNPKIYLYENAKPFKIQFFITYVEIPKFSKRYLKLEKKETLLFSSPKIKIDSI